MIVPNPAFRPNPARAVHVQGQIDQQLVQRLTPRIVLLQSQNRQPISVYIDSPGGNVASMEALLKLLTASDQDLSPACRLITVVTSRAASAAADLLSSGDYALAFPQSSVLYHGIRTSHDRPLTAETTSLLGHTLRMANDWYAMELARKVEFRFMFRFISMKDQYPGVRDSQNNPMTDLECFLELVSNLLSSGAKNVLKHARERYGRYDALLNSVLKKSNRVKGADRIAVKEAVRIKAIVDFEVRNNKAPDWSFEGGGIYRLTDDFFLLNEYLQSSQSKRFRQLCVKWSQFLLSNDDQTEIAATADDEKEQKTVEKVRPLLQPVWSFFVALCHALQEGENEITATDAFWLGLIDEVIGVHLPTSRLFAEHVPDARPEGTEAGMVGDQLKSALLP